MFKEIKKVRNEIYKWEVSLDKLDIWDLVRATREWFNYYQGKEDAKAMVELYSKLIDEEREEIQVASRNWDMIEFLDWIIDYTWVTIWFMHFGAKMHDEEESEEVNKRIWQTAIMILWGSFIDWDIIKLSWLEIAYSNWTKSLELRDESDVEGKVGKVIKGDKYKKPNLKKVFKALKTEDK